MNASRLANPGIGWHYIGSLAPPLLAGALLMAQSYQDGLAALEQQVDTAANNISRSIDTRLAGIEGRLSALAALAAMQAQDGDPASELFAASASRLMRTEETGNAIALVDATGQQRFDPAYPHAPSRQENPGPGRSAPRFALARPGITARYGASHAEGVSVAVPVLRESKVAGMLEMRIAPGRVLELLRSQQPPPGWVATLLDRDGYILARSQDNAAYAGRHAGAAWPAFSANAAALPGASGRAATTYTALARSELSGWTVALDVPRAVLEQPLRRQRAIQFGLMAACLACGLALALRFAHRTRTALRQLGASINASAAGDSRATAPRIGPPEIVALAEQFNLMQHAQRQAKAQQRLAASVFSGSAEAIVIADHQAVAVDVNQAFTSLTGFSRAAALGAGPQLLRSERQDPAQREAILLALARQGHWHGEIWIAHADGGALLALATISSVRDEYNQHTHYVAQFSDVTRQHEQRRDMERMAYYDTLTQLPNRRLLHDHIRQAFARSMRNNQMAALACLDLDGFKPINDNHGHEAGDLVLKAVAVRLGAALRPHDTAARLGGDEFVLLISDLQSRDECAAILRRVLVTLAEPIGLADGKTVQVSASIGAALYPADGKDGEQLLRQADQAMYHAKRAGRNCLRFAAAGEQAGATGRPG